MLVRNFVLSLVLLTLSRSVVLGGPGEDFFERKIRPILVEHCYACHSAEAKKQRGGLALDTKEALLRGGETGPGLVPGKPADSLLIKAVHYGDPDFRMPPKGKLPAQAIADLEKWIAMGAPDPRVGGVAKVAKGIDLDVGRKFWAFRPPVAAPIPQVKDAAWPRGDIDRFLLQKIEAKGLKPSRDADPATLLRRLHFAFVGLPPSPGEIDAFANVWAKPGERQKSIEKVVDQLLASPHFGERWGRHWLDLARYAESSGGGRSLLFKDAWRYRDYVIRSFNADVPYSRFIQEQIAGDLLDAKTTEDRNRQLVATAFLLLGPTNYERQDKPILEMDVIDEMLDTMGKSMLGMTIGCARCHDHKFDPIPTKDYYALTGIFKSTKFIVHDNVSKWNERPLPMPAELEAAVRKHEVAVAALKEKIKVAKAQNPGAITKGTAIAAKELPGIVIDDAHAKKIGSWKTSTHSGQSIGDGYLYDDRAMAGVKTLTFQPDFARAGSYEVRLAYVPHANRADKVAVRVFHADGDDTVHVNQKQPPTIDGRFISLGRFRFEQGSQWFVMLTTEGANGHVVADAVQFLSPDDVAESKAPEAKGKGASKFDLASLEAELKALEAKAPDRPKAMAVADGDKIADLHVCVRGNVHNKGETVPRGFLQVATRGAMPVLSRKESGRRELAQWLASADNPLTARVMANRVWHHLFGVGLVRTVDNFGVTGETPSHPELLDHLALRFVEEGWSVKKLIRSIVLSHAFQMSSELNAESMKLDPDNRLLWRMNRRRLDAESLRDTILVASGQLDRTAYGPTMKKGTTVERDYLFSDTRRSVYTPIFRNRLLELFEVFDFADPNLVLGKRNVSVVPTQALFLMNDPFVMAQAKKAAEAWLKADRDDAERIAAACRTALGRPPTPRERQLAQAYLSAASTSGERALAWERFAQTLFACVDFRYVN